MKELNIIEVSKIPNGEFEVYYPTGKKRRNIIRTDEKGNLKNYDGCIFSNAYYHDIIQAKFIQMPKLVSFMDVVNSGKKCRVEHKEINKENFNEEELSLLEVYSGFDWVIFTITNSSTLLAELIKNGKWYIEE